MEEKQFDDRTKRDLSLDDFLKAVYVDVKRREPALCKLYPNENTSTFYLSFCLPICYNRDVRRDRPSSVFACFRHNETSFQKVVPSDRGVFCLLRRLTMKWECDILCMIKPRVFGGRSMARRFYCQWFKC